MREVTILDYISWDFGAYCRTVLLIRTSSMSPSKFPRCRSKQNSPGKPMHPFFTSLLETKELCAGGHAVGDEEPAARDCGRCGAIEPVCRSRIARRLQNKSGVI